MGIQEPLSFFKFASSNLGLISDVSMREKIKDRIKLVREEVMRQSAPEGSDTASSGPGAGAGREWFPHIDGSSFVVAQTCFAPSWFEWYLNGVLSSPDRLCRHISWWLARLAHWTTCM